MTKPKRTLVKLSASILFGIVASSPSAYAQNAFYAGGGALGSQLEPRVNNSGFTVTEKSSVGARLFAGADLTRRLSLEGYYSYLGSARLNNSVVEGEIEYQIGGLSGLVYLYSSHNFLSRSGLQLYGRLGLGFMSNESTSSIDFRRLNNEHFAVGAGVEFGFDNGFGLRLELAKLDADAREVSINLLRRFGESRSELLVSESTISEAAGNADTLPFVRAEVATPPPPPPPPVAIDSDGDGVYDDMDLCSGAIPAVTVADNGCVSPLAMRDVSFASGSSTLNQRATAALDKVIAELVENPNLQLVIEAHTDNRGRAANNMELSRQRAISVVRYLSDSGGIEFSRLSAIGYGESRPLQSNNTAEGRRANRRVEIEVVLKKIGNV